ncbi:MAG: peptidylprolyl isomerase [Bacteroidales bacterium]|jgi:peptidyl-prolyl cis-trans isomerase A (cyclophilin A)|nr:peptidylprolyl isomerase [Bacteroidales bacterium]
MIAKHFLTLMLLLVLPSLYGQPGAGKEKIIIRTELGEIQVRIDLVRAPVTSANFLRYIDAGLFDSTCFYRVVRPDNQPKDSVFIGVIQGGRYEDEETGGFPPIPHETTEATGIRHRDGVISMARWTPGTATSEYFICVGDQPDLDYGGRRNPDGQGFAAFGKVIKGMDIVRKIHDIEAPGQYLEKPVLILGISRKSK